MHHKIDIIKGVHPGLILEREFRKRKIPKGQFAISIFEFPQTLGSITKGKRKMNIPLAMKIEKALNFDEGYLMMLQLYHDIEMHKQKISREKPNLKLLRPVLFWDTDINKIDWQKERNSVIRRVHERGNELEKREIERFYGWEAVNKLLDIS